jgi:hypothetical protein
MKLAVEMVSCGMICIPSFMKIAIKVFITYCKSHLRLCDRYISVYMLLGCSTVVVIVVMWCNCVLGSFLGIWVVLDFDLPSIV